MSAAVVGDVAVVGRHSRMGYRLASMSVTAAVAAAESSEMVAVALAAVGMGRHYHQRRRHRHDAAAAAAVIDLSDTWMIYPLRTHSMHSMLAVGLVAG